MTSAPICTYHNAADKVKCLLDYNMFLLKLCRLVLLSKVERGVLGAEKKIYRLVLISKAEKECLGSK